MLPIFHPTTTILLDDVTSYLESVVLAAPPDLPILPFDTPESAIAHIVERNQVSNKYFSDMLRIKGDTDTLAIQNEAVQEFIVRFDIGKLPSYVERIDRFNEISVIVADYAMPTMNGIEFFRKLGAIRQKKILLTGQADERIAVKAFNDGIIDQFVTKGQPGVSQRLFDLVRRYQKDYFSQQYAFISHAYHTDSQCLFANPDFDALIQFLYAELGYVEHCYANFPDGALLFTEDGERKRLVAMTDSDFDSAFETAEDDGAPAEFLNLLRKREVIPNETYAKSYTGNFTFWNENVLSAKRFDAGLKPLYYALFDLRGEIDLDRARFFRDFSGRKVV